MLTDQGMSASCQLFVRHMCYSDTPATPPVLRQWSHTSASSHNSASTPPVELATPCLARQGLVRHVHFESLLQYAGMHLPWPVHCCSFPVHCEKQRQHIMLSPWMATSLFKLLTDSAIVNSAGYLRGPRQGPAGLGPLTAV